MGNTANSPSGPTLLTTQMYGSKSSSSTSDHLLPKTSIHSIKNERYSISEPPLSDHSNEDRWFLHSDGNWFNAFGIFDGHNGANAADFASKHMKTNLEKELNCELEKRTQVEKAVCKFFISTDEAFFRNIKTYTEEKARIGMTLKNCTSYEAYAKFPDLVSRLQHIEQKISGGTTAVLAVMVLDTLYVANTGDSRALLIEQGEDKGTLVPIQLTTDHTVCNEDELCRLQSIGLNPEKLKKEGRLGGQENTRCIGDYLIKEGYKDIESLRDACDCPAIAVPSFREFKVTDKCRYLVLMTDGVYKSLESMRSPSSLEPYEYQEDILKRLLAALKKSSGNLISLSKDILTSIKEEHMKTYYENARKDVRSHLAVQCRKRDDMTLMIYSFS